MINILWVVCACLLCAAKPNPSISENRVYPAFCQTAASNEQEFAHFKRHPIYNLIQEYTTFEEGADYLDWIDRCAPDLWNKVEHFRQNDRLGDPRTFDYGKIGLFSPSTLRYIKMAGELKRAFGDLNGMRVIEMGGGYGGQCKILSDLFAFQSYTIVDFPSNLALARAYLEKLGVRHVRFLTPEELRMEESYDLAISQYGFSECNRTVQKRYLERILARADRSYLVCAFYPKHFRIRPFGKEELLEKLTRLGLSYEMLPEEPLMGKDHFILKIASKKS